MCQLVIYYNPLADPDENQSLLLTYILSSYHISSFSHLSFYLSLLSFTTGADLLALCCVPISQLFNLLTLNEMLSFPSPLEKFTSSRKKAGTWIHGDKDSAFEHFKTLNYSTGRR
jgi:hypothetical protein